MGLPLAIVAEKEVESLVIGNAVAQGAAEAPFADHAGGVSPGFQHLCDRQRIDRQRALTFQVGIFCRPGEIPDFASFAPFVVAPDVGVPGMAPRKQYAARGSANRRTGVGLGESHAAPRQIIDIGRFDFGLTVAAEFAVAQVIGHDEDDVGRCGRRFGFGFAAGKEGCS